MENVSHYHIICPYCGYDIIYYIVKPIHCPQCIKKITQTKQKEQDT